MLIQAIIKLLKIKSIVTLTLTGAFVYLCITEKLSPEFIAIYTTIVGFYFGTQYEKNLVSKDKEV